MEGGVGIALGELFAGDRTGVAARATSSRPCRSAFLRFSERVTIRYSGLGFSPHLFGCVRAINIIDPGGSGKAKARVQELITPSRRYGTRCPSI